MPEGLLQIGEVAERVGLSLRTVRYYEEVGLLRPSARSQGGFRLFSEEQVARLRILKGMKPFGLTLEEIRELMELVDRSDAGDDDDPRALADGLERFRVRAEERAAQLEDHVAEVRRLAASLAARVERLAVGRS